MPLSRREFLKGVGVTAGGLGLGAAGYDRLIPYLNQPEDIVPGVATWYATGCRECPAGCGMLVRNRESRLVKCEGNPLHPINRGSLCARGQAALQGLYDPDRIKGPMRRNEAGGFERVPWDAAYEALRLLLSSANTKRIALISDLQAGSLESLMRRWTAALGGDIYLVYEPINYESVKAVNGGTVPFYHIAASDYLVSFAADFLETWISPVEYAAAFAAMREVSSGRRGRFAYIGPRVSMTAASADVRLIVPPGALTEVAQAISQGGTGEIARKYDLDQRVVSEVAKGLKSASAPLALPGLDTDAARAASLIPDAAGLIDTGRPHALTRTASQSDMTELVGEMRAGRVDVLIISGANPAYALPDAAGFAEAVRRVPTVVSLSSFMDETSTLSHWLLPSSTPLESRGDYEPYPDVANLIQPGMGTLFDTRMTGDILLELARRAGLDTAAVFGADTFHEYLRLRWGVGTEAGIAQWEAMLEKGGRWRQTRSATPSPPSSPPGEEVREPSPPSRYEGEGVRLWAFPHPHLYDGRGANRGWLQEMPEAVTKAVWGSWAEIHPDTAGRLGVETDDLIRISRGRTSVEVPVYVWRGVARNTVAVPTGQGHTSYGRYAEGIGANILPLLADWSENVQVGVPGGSRWVTRYRASDHQHGRQIVQTTALGKHHGRDHKIDMPLPSGYGKQDFYPGHEHKAHRWAMVVDLDRCIGCHACVAACYAENNVAVVGPDGIRRKREMAWLRIDRYIDWSKASAPILFQPMLCQHCDSAPCEPVCPVFAAAHSVEGINMQVYNRCVGTRYCSNNCPYKVRRFNWFDYEWPEPLNYQLNPDVTVRCRGVMEKCTFCIQRIREVEIAARREGRPVRDGEVVPACVQTCPTGVYTFGDLMDPSSRVSQIIQSDPRAYQVLPELNTKPAVIYLKRFVEGD